MCVIARGGAVVVLVAVLAGCGCRATGSRRPVVGPQAHRPPDCRRQRHAAAAGFAHNVADVAALPHASSRSRNRST
jgi:hypothetical protein